MSYLLKPEPLLRALKGSLLQKGSCLVSGVATDSRQDVKGKVFFALKGDRFDGHDFLDQAVDQGAGAFIVSDRDKAQKLLEHKNLTVIYVPDTLKALQNLARFWAKQMKIRVVAITGSNGKTTVRSFAGTLFSPLSPFASPKSYNNPIGVPLSLLAVDRKEAVLIQEIGTDRPGEIAFLTALCDPVMSVVNMIGPAHLKELDSLESIAQEKQEIYLKSPKALWLFNRDNDWTEKMFQEFGSSHPSVLAFSSNKKDAHVRLRFLQEGAQSSLIEGCIGSIKSKARVLFSGGPNLDNLMCACGLALGAGIDPQEIWNLIPQCRLPSGRQEWFQIKDQSISILFDAYNANPSSMDFFLKSCGKFSKAGQRLCVIGDMKELGKDSVKYHKQLAGQSALLESRFVAYVGEYGGLLEEQLRGKGFKGQFVSSKTYDSQILSALSNELKPNDFVAIKASRRLGLERLLFDLTGRKTLF